MDTDQITRDGKNQSLWQKNIAPASEIRGSEISKNSDVLVVGAGITGITLALLLQRAGMNCIIADAHHAGYGTTGGTSAHINTFADTTYAEVEKAFDAKAAEQFAASISESVQLIRELVETYAIDCDFEWKKGYVYSQTDDETKELEDILTSSQKVGVAVQETSQVPISAAFQKAIVFENQAQFHPLKYILALQKEFTNLGGVTLDNTRIEEIETEDGIHIARCGEKEIRAKHVVYATHIPPGGINLLHFRNAPYRSYVIAATLNTDEYPEALIYDMKDPYHYFRTHTIDGQKYLIAGGHDHKTGHGDPEQSFEDLINFTSTCYPVKDIYAKWSAQYYVPSDGVPYIGKLPGASEGIYAATGFNGNGMILGTVSAIVLFDLILNGNSTYQDLYDPGRIKPIAGFTEFVKENADVAARFVADRFGIEELESVSTLAADSGEILEFDGQKLAVYKDAAGKMHALDPVCTHAKCIVQWNNSEKSWDCPCHGARFDTNGTVLTGPARQDLRKVEVSLPESR